DRSLKDRPMPGGLCCGRGRDGAAPPPGSVCPVLRTLPGWTGGHAPGNVGGRASCPLVGRACMKVRHAVGLFLGCCAASLLWPRRRRGLRVRFVLLMPPPSPAFPLVTIVAALERNTFRRP